MAPAKKGTKAPPAAPPALEPQEPQEPPEPQVEARQEETIQPPLNDPEEEPESKKSKSLPEATVQQLRKISDTVKNLYELFGIDLHKSFEGLGRTEKKVIRVHGYIGMYGLSTAYRGAYYATVISQDSNIISKTVGSKGMLISDIASVIGYMLRQSDLSRKNESEIPTDVGQFAIITSCGVRLMQGRRQIDSYSLPKPFTVKPFNGMDSSFHVWRTEMVATCEVNGLGQYLEDADAAAENPKADRMLYGVLQTATVEKGLFATYRASFAESDQKLSGHQFYKQMCEYHENPDIIDSLLTSLEGSLEELTISSDENIDILTRFNTFVKDFSYFYIRIKDLYRRASKHKIPLDDRKQPRWKHVFLQRLPQITYIQAIKPDLEQNETSVLVCISRVRKAVVRWRFANGKHVHLEAPNDFKSKGGDKSKSNGGEKTQIVASDQGVGSGKQRSPGRRDRFRKRGNGGKNSEGESGSESRASRRQAQKSPQRHFSNNAQKNESKTDSNSEQKQGNDTSETKSILKKKTSFTKDTKQGGQKYRKRYSEKEKKRGDNKRQRRNEAHSSDVAEHAEVDHDILNMID